MKAHIMEEDTLYGLIAEGVRGAQGKPPMVLGSLNLHSIYCRYTDARFRALEPKARWIVDGISIVWLFKLFGHPVSPRHRLAWIDFFWPLLERAERNGWRVFYLGAEKPVVEAGIAKVRERLPDLSIAYQDGFFDADPESEGSREVACRINAAKPDILIVGMGMGRQEAWILDNLDRLDAKVIMTAGACIEYFADAAALPPRWLGRLGFEWLYRLLSDPRRFWKRYLVEPWIVAWLLARHYWRDRRSLSAAGSEPPSGAS